MKHKEKAGIAPGLCKLDRESSLLVVAERVGSGRAGFALAGGEFLGGFVVEGLDGEVLALLLARRLRLPSGRR